MKDEAFSMPIIIDSDNRLIFYVELKEGHTIFFNQTINV